MAQIASLVASGQKAHEEKEYSTALVYFNDAYRLWKEKGRRSFDILSILDLRIATYVKLRKLSLARDDAKAMIRNDRADGRGYLRCGQIERLNGDCAAALKWYEYGLKNLASTDRIFPMILTQHAKMKELVTSRITMSKAVDPVARLPAEIIQMIADYLGYKQLVGCLRVSKCWSRALRGLQPLTDTLDFENANRKLNYHMLKACLGRLSKWPKALIVKNLSEPAANLLKSHLEGWANYNILQHLRILDGNLQLTSLLAGLQYSRYDLRSVYFGPQCAVSTAIVRQVLQTCDKLESASFMKIMPISTRGQCIFYWEDTTIHLNLTNLSMRFERGHVVLMPFVIFRSFPHLTELECSGVEFGSIPSDLILDLSHISRLAHLNLSNAVIRTPLRLPLSLEAYTGVNTSVLFEIIDRSRPRLPTLTNLSKIDVSGSNNGMIGQMHDWLPSHSKAAFTHLAIGDNDLSLAYLKEHLTNGNLKSLRYLDLKAQMLCDDDRSEFRENLPALETLILRNAMITGIFLIGLLEESSLLFDLALYDCTHVSPDAIEWARRRGVKVKISNTDASTLSWRRVMA